jgi:hypothetical protein
MMGKKKMMKGGGKTKKYMAGGGKTKKMMAGGGKTKGGKAGGKMSLAQLKSMAKNMGYTLKKV